MRGHKTTLPVSLAFEDATLRIAVANIPRYRAANG